MPFRAYLRTHAGAVSEKTLTNDPAAALAAFSSLVERADLDGQPLAAALTGDQKQIAYHRFDRAPGDPDYWRDRLDEIEMPGFGKPGRGGARPGSGPKLEVGSVRRVSVTLDPESIELAENLGGGNVSRGIRAALRIASGAS